MFDFSFGELAIIGAVALVVLGPEKLPKVARTAGQWMSKAQRYVNDVKADIQRETELAELKKLQQQVQASAQELEQSMQSNLHSIESEVRQTGHEAGHALSGEGAAASSESGALHTPAYDHLLEQGEGLGHSTRADFVTAPPTFEELVARVEALQAQVARARAPSRFKYAPRARAMRTQPTRLRGDS